MPVNVASLIVYVSGLQAKPKDSKALPWLLPEDKTTHPEQSKSTIDNANDKLAKLDKAVSLVDAVADGISLFGDKVVNLFTSGVGKLFKKKNKNKKENEEGEDENE